MNAYRKRVMSHLCFAVLAVVSGTNPFADALQAQSSSVPAPLRALPENESPPEAPADSGAPWPGARPLADRVPDLKCAIVEILAGPPRPALVVVCPPQEVFAPLRLYFKLSWKHDEDIPADFQALAAQAKTQTKIYWTQRGDYHVLLQAERKNGRGGSSEWVNFTDLVGVYIKY